MKKEVKILLVDDEKRFLDLTSLMLKKMNIDSESCTRGSLAIEKITKHPRDYDLVMLDMIMPELNGTQTYLKIREINPKLPVIFISGYSLSKSSSQLLKTGVVGYLQKPFKKNELEDILKRNLEY